MTKVQQNFEMWSGDHKNVSFIVTDSAGASVSLAGASGTWLVYDLDTGASVARLNTDSGSGITLSGCTMTVSLSPAHTSSLDGRYGHEAQIRDSASDISTVAVGVVTIQKDYV